MKDVNEPLYDIQRFRPEHAQGVSRCFFDVYGNSYPTAFVYEPESLIDLNESGNLISIVTISNETNEVVGHGSAQRCYPGGAAESGLAVVKRAHEGHFLLAQMIKCLDKEVLLTGVRCMVSHEVTSHRASQVIARRAGFKNCCLALGAMPSSLDFKKTTGVVAQRESCVVSMKFLADPETAIICAPSHHQDMIEQIYAHLGRPISFEQLPMQDGAGSVTVRFNSSWEMGDIQVQCTGTDTASDIKRYLRDLLDKDGAAAVFLERPLDQRGIEDICRAAESEGFFFAGLGPNTTHGGESLFLQYVASKLDMSLFQVASPMGKKIFNYVANERKRLTK
ncbi:hypothetical protein [Maridesulfovibrio frigidus]|uniref:hypothetical protein n=1 Tax=Maridesulfovibrio frigidus TaxID=340956 RepID=UPI0004E28AD2|nr:hypothetical protein [Maridesulfovibrio frigidus]